MISTLDLVCSPIPNGRAKDVMLNEEAVQLLRTSDFYMIGGRGEAKFSGFRLVEADLLEFEISVLGGCVGSGGIRISRIPSLKDVEEGSKVGIRYGEEFISFVLLEDGGQETMLAAFGTEDVLWRRGRREPFIEGFDNHLELACYDLLYVGIATETDSYSRLIQKGHTARQQILSDEPQRYPGARVTDEIFLMLFRAEPLLIKSWGAEDEIEVSDIQMTYSNERLVKDAEKAFISVLRPPYNKQLYSNYPKGKDGNFSVGYTGYSYSLSDGLALRTAFGSMKGAREEYMTMSNDADFISIKGDSVTLRIAGADQDLDASNPFSGSVTGSHRD
ncbi:hypothetical protein [Stenotrophomonas maltophilia]|uniref:hypothetical protein n=1 Tax=Stenotrophomonas maltophilia TaxID=40324 RepID=UPI001F536448|nr:hypothetical protein [Stenotrophomonas maltophilia]MCI1150436.1 hypothetical protein [Stenotrophomonas maltophilia]